MSQGIAYETPRGRLQGRQLGKKAHELDQTLGDAEEKVVVTCIEEMDCRAFSLIAS